MGKETRVRYCYVCGLVNLIDEPKEVKPDSKDWDLYKCPSHKVPDTPSVSGVSYGKSNGEVFCSLCGAHYVSKDEDLNHACDHLK